MQPGDQCPGCGASTCGCTPAEIRAQLVKDRAELSDRAARYTARANEAAAVMRGLLSAVQELRAQDPDFGAREIDDEIAAAEIKAERWLTPMTNTKG